MKKVIIYTGLIILGNYLCMEFAFKHDDSRFIALFGFLMVAYCTIQLPFRIAELLSHQKFSYSIMMNADRSDKSLNKPAMIWCSIFIVMIALQIWIWVSFFKYQDQLLFDNGILQKTVVLDKKWEYNGKNSKAWHIHYEYEYKGKNYQHKTVNDLFETGDTITIKFLPENPDNHTVVLPHD